MDSPKALEANRSSSRHRLLVLLLLVLLSRLVFAFIVWKINGPAGFISRDTDSYVVPAQSLLHGSFLANGSFSLRGKPEIFRTPGYPLLLTPGVAVGHVVLMGLIENLLLAVASGWLIWRIVAELDWGPAAAFWAVLLYCVEPIGFLNSLKLLTETTFTFLFLLFVWIFLRALRAPRYTTLAVAAVILGCATYVRPVSIYLALWVAPLLLVFPRESARPQRAMRAILFPTLFAMTLVPWSVRNSAVAGYNSFSSAADLNLYYYCAAAVEAKLQHRTQPEVAREWGNEPVQYLLVHPEQRNWSEGQIVRYCRTEANTILRPHLLAYSLMHARGCGMIMLNPGVSELLRNLGVYPVMDSPLSAKLEEGMVPAMRWLLHQYPITAIAIPLMVIQLLVYYWLAFKGIRRLRPDSRFFLAGLVVYFALISGIPGASARYRAPIMPLVCVCAGVAIAYRKTGKPTVTARD